MGHDLAPCGRQGTQRIRVPSVHHCLALREHPDALRWPSLGGQTSAPSALPRAGGGARASTLNGASVLQRMTCHVPALPARVTCHRPCHRGTSTGGRGDPEVPGGGGGAHRGRVRVEARVRKRCHYCTGGSQVGGAGRHRLPTPPRPLRKDTPPPIFGERRRRPSPTLPFNRPRGTATPERFSGKARPQSWTRSCLHAPPPW